MNKKDLATVVLLILLIPVVLEIDRRFFQTDPVDMPPPPVDEEVVTPPRREPAAPGLVAAPGDEGEEDAPPAVVDLEDAPPAVVEVEEVAPEVDRDMEEITHVLRNELVSVDVSNFGAGIRRVVLEDYEASIQDNQARDNDEPWEPITLDFSDAPALVYAVAGFNHRAGFEVEVLEPGRLIQLSRQVGNLRFVREILLGEDYTLEIRDQFINTGDQALRLQDMPIWLGRMYPLENVSQKFGPFLGVDAFHRGGIGVKHYLKQITKDVRRADSMKEERVNERLDWFTVKNKFFTQVLTLRPGEHSGALALLYRALPGEGDARVGMVQSGAVIEGVERFEAGQVHERVFQYYVGPILSDNLRELGMGQEAMIDVRLWRIFVPLGKLMLTGLNSFYAIVGNWGVAIILLTVVVRLLFWPLTAKGAANMKKMSELSPQIKEIKEKYKNNPQKMNQAMGQLYRDNKVNPMAGCLPMIVQIPVFFSLYGVLRIAVELRYADFLWVKDLSEPEHLFFLFGFPVNLLPLTMGATMILQQRMTPSSMDEQQRKIMMMMPVVFLVFTYNMPSGLLLYWTTSNLISIFQSWHTRRNQKAVGGGVAAPAPAVQGPTQLTKRKPTGKKKKK